MTRKSHHAERYAREGSGTSRTDREKPTGPPRNSTALDHVGAKQQSAQAIEKSKAAHEHSTQANNKSQQK
jgi:hypothetical protein